MNDDHSIAPAEQADEANTPRGNQRASRRATRVPRVAQQVWETKQWAMMRQALGENRRIVCFDAEWEYQPPNRVTELGIAIMHHGQITGRNVRVRPGGRRFFGGKTAYLTEDAARAWLARVMDSAELLVGHALKNDRLKMKQWGVSLSNIRGLPAVDTSTWSRITNQESANPLRLAHLAKRYGIDHRGTHVAGNDALITLKVALAMAAVEPPEQPQLIG